MHQPPLPLDMPAPDLHHPTVLSAARRLFDRRPYWRRHYCTLEQLLADAPRARVLLICARQAQQASRR